MVGAIAGSTQREPITVGKPAEFMLDNIARTFGLQRQQICMVGDRLDTDILFGKNGGLTTCLVLSGARARRVCAHPRALGRSQTLRGCVGARARGLRWRSVR
jgi:phosphoglycolate phosphatase